MSNHLFDALFAEAPPDAVAIRHGEGVLTYGELELETARWAQALESLNVQVGDRVAAQVEKSLEGLILYLATVRIGAVYLPLNPAYTLAELSYFIGDAEPALVVCDLALVPRVEEIAGSAEVVGLDRQGRGELYDLAQTNLLGGPPAPRAPEDLAAICYTSGTTGRSKGAMLTHRALESNASTLKDLWRFTEADVLIHALPTYHVHGLFVAMHTAMMAGASIILQSNFDPAAVIAAMPAATSLMGVPTHYTRLLTHPGLTREATAGMRLFISGSAPLLAQTHHAWREKTGHPILERYGMTETGMNTSNPYDGERRAGTVGFPLPGVELRVVSERTGEALAPGEIGGIEIRGPNVCAGYWRNPEKTGEAFRDDGFFVTGDLGCVDDDGYLSIVGRDKDLVITGGLNVYPKEVETEIDAIEGVVESAIIGLPHADFGEVVTAVVAVGNGGPTSLTERAILDRLTDRLARFKQPKRVVFVADLPRNAMGKVQKAKLRETYAGLYPPAS
ncbi:MAG TPA: malonyl-CoA synthase [Caulobacteraceae bacterium]|jgi:malonyl-CoA/methylmalonyl-CoA synthetase|nr:malonyl-CoA synthase [Caulobacteraceae bacterium]